jgi:hypothetical protein
MQMSLERKMLFVGSLILGAMVNPLFFIAAEAVYDDSNFNDVQNDVLDRMLDETRYPAFYRHDV